MRHNASREFLAEVQKLLAPEAILSHVDDLLVYECDGYTLEKHAPDLVLLPETTQEVSAIVKLCAKHNVPFIPRGAGTNLSGALLPVGGGVLITLTRMNRILSID